MGKDIIYTFAGEGKVSQLSHEITSTIETFIQQ
jgi:hypothetical protein